MCLYKKRTETYVRNDQLVIFTIIEHQVIFIRWRKVQCTVNGVLYTGNRAIDMYNSFIKPVLGGCDTVMM